MGVKLVNLAHDLGIEPGALIRKIVAGNAGNGGVVKVHFPDVFGHAARFVAVEFFRLAGGNIAEVAAAGALIATDKERSLAGFPALVDIRAACLLAHGVQGSAGHAGLHVLVARAGADLVANPAWLLFDG